MKKSFFLKVDKISDLEKMGTLSREVISNQIFNLNKGFIVLGRQIDKRIEILEKGMKKGIHFVQKLLGEENNSSKSGTNEIQNFMKNGLITLDSKFQKTIKILVSFSRSFESSYKNLDTVSDFIQKLVWKNFSFEISYSSLSLASTVNKLKAGYQDLIYIEFKNKQTNCISQEIPLKVSILIFSFILLIL